MACTADSAAASGFFSPMRRATSAVVPIAMPIATALTSVRTDSVKPTVATAEAPSDDTKYMSTTAKTDSSTISSIIGTASRRMAFPIPPVV